MGKFYFIGDIHGDWRPVRNLNMRIKERDGEGLTDEDTVVLLGDAGLNFFLNHQDDEFKKKLSEFNCTFFVIRGNHDARPSKFVNESNQWGVIFAYGGPMIIEWKYPNILYAADAPAVYMLDNLKTFVIPGAYSVDKYYRLQNGWTWFDDEQLDENEMMIGHAIAREYEDFDLILSHTCPIHFEPTDLFIEGLDQSMVDKRMERYLQKLENKIGYDVWLWGHYHKFRVYPSTADAWGLDRKRYKIMLFNDYALELQDIMSGNHYDGRIDIRYWKKGV